MSLQADYTYDVSGQRTRSVVTVTGGPTTTTDFVYEGLLLQSLSASQAGPGATSFKLSYHYDEYGRPYAGVYRSPASSPHPLVFGILTSDRGMWWPCLMQTALPSPPTATTPGGIRKKRVKLKPEARPGRAHYPQPRPLGEAIRELVPRQPSVYTALFTSTARGDRRLSGDACNIFISHPCSGREAGAA